MDTAASCWMSIQLDQHWKFPIWFMVEIIRLLLKEHRMFLRVNLTAKLSVHRMRRQSRRPSGRLSPSKSPSGWPTVSPSPEPTDSPTKTPTSEPSDSPTTPAPTHPGELICDSHDTGDYNGEPMEIEV